MPEADEYRKLFLRILKTDVYRSTLNNIMNMVSEESSIPALKKKQQQWLSLYRDMDECDRTTLHSIVDEALQMSIFNVLAMLDGASFGTALEDKVAHFALYLQEYETWDDYKRNNPKKLTQLNPWEGSGEIALHDLFFDLLGE